MAAQKQNDQLERTFSSYVRIQVVVRKTYLGRWTIGRSGERGSGISVLPARYDDDDTVSLLTTRNTYEYENIRLYLYFRRWHLCGAEKQSQRVRAHVGDVGRRKSQWTTDLSRNSGTYIVYNSHVTCSNSSFSLTMVMPTSHFFASHWLLAQARFCGRTHLPLLPNSTMPTVQVIFRYLWRDAPVFNITTVGMVTFRQSPCWYNPWADVAMSTSSDTQHLWTWWHFGDHTGLINLSVNNIRRIHTRRSR